MLLLPLHHHTHPRSSSASPPLTLTTTPHCYCPYTPQVIQRLTSPDSDYYANIQVKYWLQYHLHTQLLKVRGGGMYWLQRHTACTCRLPAAPAGMP